MSTYQRKEANRQTNKCRGRRIFEQETKQRQKQSQVRKLSDVILRNLSTFKSTNRLDAPRCNEKDAKEVLVKKRNPEN